MLRGAIDACLAVIIDEIHGQYLILFFYISSIHDWQLFCNLKFTNKLVPINIQSDILAVRQKCGRRIFSVVLYWLFIVFFCETSSTDNIDRPSLSVRCNDVGLNLLEALFLLYNNRYIWLLNILVPNIFLSQFVPENGRFNRI